MSESLDIAARLLKVSDLLHRLGSERLDEGKSFMKMDVLDEVDNLFDEANLLFDAEKVVLEKVKAIHDSLRSQP